MAYIYLLLDQLSIHLRTGFIHHFFWRHIWQIHPTKVINSCLIYVSVLTVLLFSTQTVLADIFRVDVFIELNFHDKWFLTLYRTSIQHSLHPSWRCEVLYNWQIIEHVMWKPFESNWTDFSRKHPCCKIISQKWLHKLCRCSFLTKKIRAILQFTSRMWQLTLLQLLAEAT